MKPTWLLRKTGNSAPEADLRIPPNKKKKRILRTPKTINHDTSYTKTFLTKFRSFFKTFHCIFLVLTSVVTPTCDEPKRIIWRLVHFFLESLFDRVLMKMTGPRRKYTCPLLDTKSQASNNL